MKKSLELGLCAVLSAAGAPVGTVDAQEAMTLQQCVDYSLAHSRELAKLRIGLRNQELTTRIERGKFRPLLKVSAVHDPDESSTAGAASLRQEVPAGITATVSGAAKDSGDEEADSANLAVEVTKVLLGGGSWRESMLEIDNSLLDELIQLNRLHRYKRELVSRVRQNYYRLIRTHQTLRINQMRLDRARKNLEHAIERQRPLDIATARIEVPENEAGVLQAERQIRSALDDLKILIGMDVAQELAVAKGFAFAEQKLDVESDIIFSMANHEDILNAGLLKKQVENQWGVQRARRWPELSLSASSGRRSRDGIELEGETETSVGLALSWEPGSLTDRLRTERLQHNIEAQGIEVEDLKQDKARSIRDLGRRIRETLQLVRLQEQKLTVAEHRSELYADRWENGEIDILEYIRSQNDLENSRIQLVNLQTTYMGLIGEYEFVVGR